jgi:transcription elongation GreA/GreB family factor
MNSTIQLHSRRGSVFVVELVYPRNADGSRRKVSVLSTLGLELIGRSEGEPILRHMIIEKLLSQPESQGNYYT